MSNSLRIYAMAALLVALTSALASAAEKRFKLPGFAHSFRVSERNQPGGFSMVKDPLDASNSKKVYKFSIAPGPCVKQDCEQQSARGSVQQVSQAKQPKEAWYGWDMYFPTDFPYGINQIRGHQIFPEFKDQHQCQLVALTTNPHSNGQNLSWSMEKPTGIKATQFGGDCTPVFEKPVAKFRDIVGAWHRYELFVRWSKKDDGKFLMYLDGKLVVEYAGFTCFECDKMNQFYFGNYLCCTPDTKQLKAAIVYYRYVSSAKSREALLWK